MSKIIQPLYRTPLNMNESNPDVGILCSEQLTQQHFKDECDINFIVDSYGRGAHMVNGIRVQDSEPQYLDCTTAVGLKESIIMVNQAQDEFDSLPLNIRKEFDYDPVKLLEFCENPDNKDRAIELGLINKPSVTEVAGVPDSTPQQTAVSEASSA